MLNLKQRIFLDIMNQIPFGSNKMAKYDNVSSAYSDELIKDTSSELYATIAKKVAKEHAGFDNLFNWMISVELTNYAYDECEKARNWLIEQGYVRKFVKESGTKRYYYYGLTDKGWRVAPKYKALQENLKNF